MKKLLLLSVLVGLLVSCNQKSEEQIQMEAAMAVYDQNAKSIQALFDALENEDLFRAIVEYFT